MSGNADGPDARRTPDRGELDPVGTDRTATVEQDLLAEIHNLNRLLAEHERATDQAFNEMKQFKFGAVMLHPEFKKFVYDYRVPAPADKLPAVLALQAD